MKLASKQLNITDLKDVTGGAVLRDHIITKGGTEVRRYFQHCDICGKMFWEGNCSRNYNAEFLNHMQTHKLAKSY